jgi:hypothetical protein
MSLIWRGLALVVAVLAGPAFGMGQGLKVCVESGAAPLSSEAQDGMDLAATRLVADWLGRPLEIVWYEGEDDADASPAAQVNGLLSAGLCQVAAGFPLVSDALRAPAPSAPYPLVLPDRSRRFVQLGTLAHSAPYRAVDYRLILGKSVGVSAVASLDEVKGLRLLADQNSLADNLLLAHGGGVLREHIVHVPLPVGALVALARGDGDAALVEGPQFDAWRAAHADSALRDSGYRHPLRVNVGFVALDVQRGLLELFDQAIADLLESGDLDAAYTRLGYALQKPVELVVLPPLTQRMLGQSP